MSRGVELVRVEREERVFDRERMLGRDATSVFPSLAEESKDANVAEGVAVKSKFVTESELQELRQRGIDDAARDANNASRKPLYQVLAEAKERKNLEFEEHWTEMKIGKNRPLDAEEFEFLSRVEDEKRAIELKRKREEMSEIEAFRKIQQQQVEVAEVKTTDQVALAPPCVVARRAKPKVAVKSKATVASAAPDIANTAIDDDDDVKTRALGGLLGDYGSDSDD